MKFWKIFFMVLGTIFLLLALIGVSQMHWGKEGETAYQVGYIIGSLVGFIPATLFFYLAYRQHRKIQKKKLQQTIDMFMK